ncbi:MAG: SAM-dependent methyltransferase [Clostridia bacterium]|nr:SAM-dependent methyltransferase [Clostridia bacterium]
MALKYESVVPWGRSFEEYVDMFNLTQSDLDKSILGCGDGPAGFNSSMKQKGKKVISVDPVYQFSGEDIARRIEETYHNVINQTRQNRDKFIWSKIKTVEDLGEVRMAAMKEFLSDYEEGRKEGRYVFAGLPVLPFQDNQFELSLASHFLFLYTDNLSLDFHLQSISEMLRVSKEIRIFPLVDVNAVRSPYVNEIIFKYKNYGYDVEEEKVGYEFQKGGNTMLRISGGEKK